MTFNSQGVYQFTEVWAVPPSSVPLRVSAVLVSQGTVVGPPPLVGSTTVTISDVVGLENELALLPQEGVAFAVGRTAVINSSGQIDGASGNLSDCVRVDGSSGPCGSGGGGVLPSFSDSETPAGSINGSNSTFTLANTPSPAASLALSLNGLRMSPAVDFTITGNTISFLTPSTPQTGDILTASYRYANPSNPLGTLTTPQVICSSVGTGTSATALTQLGSCTIPAGLLGTGDTIEISYQYGHTGTTQGFTGQINFGTATLVSRSTAASETALAGRTRLGVGAGVQPFNGESWGNSLSFAAAVGSASQNTALSLTISFQADLAASTTDTITLSSFTVIRYPAQSNP